MSKRRRFHAIIVPKVLHRKRHRGLPCPTNSPHKFDVDEVDASKLIPQLPGRNICYNHNVSDVLGRVLASARHPETGAIEIDYDIDCSTPRGEEMAAWVDKGRMRGISLQHLWSTSEPLEVSICWKGARPGSRTTRCLPTNVAGYTPDGSTGSDTAVAASADGLDDDDEDLWYIPIERDSVAASSAMSDVAPPAAVPVPAPAATAAPAAAPAAAPMEDVEGDAGAAAPPAFSTFDIAKSLAITNAIPSAAQRKALYEGVGKLEIEAEKLRQAKAAADAELKQYKEREAKIRQEAEAKAKAETEEKLNVQRQLVGDFLMTHDPPPEEAAKIKASVMGMDEMQLAGLVAVAASARKKFEGNLALESEVERYRKSQATNATAPAVPVTPAESPVAASTTGGMQFNGWGKKPAAPPASAADSVAASSEDGVDVRAMSKRPLFNKRAQTDAVAAHYVRGEHVRASGGRNEYDYVDTEQAEWRRGAGNNFKRNWIVSASLATAVAKAWDATPGGDGSDESGGMIFPTDFSSEWREGIAKYCQSIEASGGTMDVSALVSASNYSNMLMR